MKKVGSKFKYNGVTLEVVETDGACEACYMQNFPCYSEEFKCSPKERSDMANIIFKEVKDQPNLFTNGHN